MRRRLVLGLMKTTHALNFFLIGLTMCFSPAYWPAFFINESTGDNTNELWMLTMGLAQMILGAWTIGINVVPRLLYSLGQWDPLAMNFALPDVGWVMPESFYAALQDEDDVSVALSLQQQLQLGRA